MSFLASILFLLLPVGEELHYSVRFGPLRVGTLDLTIQNITLFNQESSYHFVARLKSNPGWRFLFNIDDQLESYARISDFATLQSLKRVSESGYQKLTQADFNYPTKKIYYSDSSSFDLVPDTKDLLSTWYYFRTQSIKPNDTLSIIVHMDKSNYNVKILTTGPKFIQTGIGKLECIILKPTTRFKQDIGTVYLTYNTQRVPAMIQKRFSFGNIVAILEKIGGL